MSADTLKAILMRYRGGWLKKLPPELRSILDALDADPARAAVMHIFGSPLCEKGRERPFKRIGEGWQFCGKLGKCACRTEVFREKSATTNLAKRGVRNAAQAADVKAKMRATCLDRYGVETTGADPQRQARAAATLEAKHGPGVRNAFQIESVKEAVRRRVATPEVQAILKDGLRRKHGVENAMHVPGVKARQQSTVHALYGGRAPAACEQVRAKMRATMAERFGGHYANQYISPEHRIRGEDDFRARFTGRKASEIAEETGYDASMIHRYAGMWGVELDHTGGSKRGVEDAFAAALETLGVPFRRNVRCLLAEGSDRDGRKKQEVDFVFGIPSTEHPALGIELSGAIWHSTANGKDRFYHRDKRLLAAEAGISLVQIFEDEWNDRPAAVLSAVRHRLNLSQDRVMARKCNVAAVEPSAAADFLDRHHVLGPGTGSSARYGLRDKDGALVAVMAFTRRSRAESSWEMVRYATSVAVPGGASRLLARFEREQEWEEIKSFVDLRWGDGGVYPLLGFERDEEIPPDYAYVIGARRVHKFNLRKSSRRFAKFDPVMSERQMAEALNIPRVYDAGKIRVRKRRVR